MINQNSILHSFRHSKSRAAIRPVLLWKKKNGERKKKKGIRIDIGEEEEKQCRECRGSERRSDKSQI